jgi:hypothetical protein
MEASFFKMGGRTSRSGVPVTDAPASLPLTRKSLSLIGTRVVSRRSPLGATEAPLRRREAPFARMGAGISGDGWAQRAKAGCEAKDRALDERRAP